MKLIYEFFLKVIEIRVAAAAKNTDAGGLHTAQRHSHQSGSVLYKLHPQSVLL